jgi:hypothetical protein
MIFYKLLMPFKKIQVTSSKEAREYTQNSCLWDNQATVDILQYV